MNLLFHTIALEPARWTPQRTSQDLADLLPLIASAGFDRIEVYEPHLKDPAATQTIRNALQAGNLVPEVLSSYLNLNPTQTSSSQLDAQMEELRDRINTYGFRRVRIFPGPGMNPADKPGVAIFIERLEKLITALPGTEILLETHDGSLADDAETITQIVRDLNAPSVGLLYQPTFFQPERALRQFALQQPCIRHVHLQNRNPDLTFSTLRDGIVPWPQIIPQLDKTVTATLEFVPIGICSIEKFDLTATLREAQSEAAYVREISK
jgi:sugar phosphate isomerase/epimerase